MADALVDLIRQTWDSASYLDRPVPVECMLGLFETVRWVPSAANVQPWEFFLVQDPGRRRAAAGCLLDGFLRPFAPDGLLERAPIVLAVAVDRKRAAARHGELGLRLLAIQDTTAAIVCLRLAAAQQGIGSAWMREVDLERLAEALALPRGLQPVALLSFGYPARPPSSVAGMPVADSVHLLGA